MSNVNRTSPGRHGGLNRMAQAKCRPPVSPNYTPLFEGGEENNLV